MKTVKVTISGAVQGVFFRKYTLDKAQKLSLDGSVRNLPDGRVEAIARGKNDSISEFVNWCYQGSPLSNVTEVSVEDLEEKPVGKSGFRILY